MQEFYPCINSLIDNLDNNKYNRNVNIILDGGAFNGPYQLGVLAYFRTLEKKGFITINRLSGCSIGSVSGFLYILDQLDAGILGYSYMRKSYSETGSFEQAKKWIKQFNNTMDKNDYLKFNGKLFITYYNIKTCKQKCISHFKNNKHLLEVIIRSMSVPFLYDGSIAYKNRYLDGFTPHIFQDDTTDNYFINLHSFDKIYGMVNIQHNKNSSSRILNGIENAHNFYISKQHNSICSNINNWSYLESAKFSIRCWLYSTLVCILSVLHYINCGMNNNNSTSKCSNILRQLYVICIKEFFV